MIQPPEATLPNTLSPSPRVPRLAAWVLSPVLPIVLPLLKVLMQAYVLVMASVLVLPPVLVRVLPPVLP